MARRVAISERCAVEPDAFLKAFPNAIRIDDGYTWAEPSPLDDGTLKVTVRTKDDRLELSGEFDARVPYFGWVFNGLFLRAVRARLVQIARTLEAVSAGRGVPAEPKRPWWSPPGIMTHDQIRTIASITLLMALSLYASSLLTQTIDYVARTYGATNAQLGVVTAITRVGNLIVIAGGLLADRIGRRRLLLATVALVLVCTSLSAAAPSLAAYGALQIVVNGGTNLAFLVGYIIAVEEAPEASRTYTIAIVGIGSGLGFVLGALLLPIADVGHGAWRAMYAIGALGLLFLPSVSRNLRESHRFEALAARHARGRIGEVVDPRYGRRFAVMCVTGFLLNLFLAPQSQFTNRYLRDIHHFSGSGILVLRAVTQAVPSLMAAYAGGRLAESRGRRPIARGGLVLGAIATAAFFVGGGPLLWVALSIATIGLALAGPSLSAFTSELFPTEVRGTAGAGQVIASVMGSATGLLAAGYLASPLGSIGRAVAVTTIGPLAVALLLIPFLPESRGLLLDDVSPPEV